MIRPLRKFIKDILIPKFEYKEEKVETKETPTYTGVPAPVIAPSDPWFSDPPMSQKQMDYMEREVEIKKKEDRVEDPDIHQKIYEIATRGWATVKESKGWQSGTGYNQFRG